MENILFSRHFFINSWNITVNKNRQNSLLAWCGRQPLKWPAMVLTSLCPPTCAKPFPWMLAGPSDLLLIEYGKSVTSEIRLQTYCGFHLGILFHSSACALWGKPATTLWVALWEGVHGQGTEGGLWSTASKELRPSVQQPTRNWVLLRTVCVNLETYSSLSKPLHKATTAAVSLTEFSWQTSKHRHLAKLCQES